MAGSSVQGPQLGTGLIFSHYKYFSEQLSGDGPQVNFYPSEAKGKAGATMNLLLGDYFGVKTSNIIVMKSKITPCVIEVSYGYVLKTYTLLFSVENINIPVMPP